MYFYGSVLTFRPPHKAPKFKRSLFHYRNTSYLYISQICLNHISAKFENLKISILHWDKLVKVDMMHCVLLSPSGSSCVMGPSGLGPSWSYLVLLGPPRSLSVLLGPSGFFQVLLGTSGSFWILLGPSGSFLVLTDPSGIVFQCFSVNDF